MINVNDINLDNIQNGLDLNGLVYREVSEHEEGKRFTYNYLQFEVLNSSGANLKDAIIKLSYYDSDNTFLGCDEDLDLEKFSPHTSKSFSLLIDPPEETRQSSLEIKFEGTNLYKENSGKIWIGIAVMYLVWKFLFSGK